MQSKWIAAAVACALTLTSSADAGRWTGPGSWRVIATKVVNGGADTDWIYTPGARRYYQVRLCAENAPLHMKDFDIYFANGGHQDVRTRDILRPGTCTRVIELSGRATRDVTRVRLKYGQLARGLRQAPLVRVTAR